MKDHPHNTDAAIRVLPDRDAAFFVRSVDPPVTAAERYALNHDGLRGYLASDEESKAADRALLMLAGHRTLNTPPPRR